MRKGLSRRALFALPMALPVAAVAAKVAPAVVEEFHVIPQGGYERVLARLAAERRERLQYLLRKLEVHIPKQMRGRYERDHVVMVGARSAAEREAVLAAARHRPCPYGRVAGFNADGDLVWTHTKSCGGGETAPATSPAQGPVVSEPDETRPAVAGCASGTSHAQGNRPAGVAPGPHDTHQDEGADLPAVAAGRPGTPSEPAEQSVNPDLLSARLARVTTTGKASIPAETPLQPVVA